MRFIFLLYIFAWSAMIFGAEKTGGSLELDKELVKVINDISVLKTGSTRAEVDKLLVLSAGLSRREKAKYQCIISWCIKVDIEYSFNETEPELDDKIKTISRMYLEVP